MGFFDFVGNVGRSVVDATKTAGDVWVRSAKMAFMPSKQHVLDMYNYTQDNPEKISNMLQTAGTAAAFIPGIGPAANAAIGAGVGAISSVLEDAAAQQAIGARWNRDNGGDMKM